MCSENTLRIIEEIKKMSEKDAELLGFFVTSLCSRRQASRKEKAIVAKKLAEMSEEQVSEVLCFMECIGAERDVWIQSDKKEA